MSFLIIKKRPLVSVPLVLVGFLVLAGGCLDVRDFEGSWAGAIVAEEAVRQGFGASVKVDPLVLADVDLVKLSATLTTSDGKFQASTLQRVTRFTADTMASMSFDTSPVRSYLHYAPPSAESGGCNAMVLISLFGDEHVEVRIIRGNDLFGVFSLKRQ